MGLPRLKSPTVLRADRVPPGQYRTDKFPVLSLTAPPPFDPRTWRLTVSGLVAKPAAWSWDELLQLPAVELDADFHCVTRWSRLDNVWTGILATTLRDL